MNGVACYPNWRQNVTLNGKWFVDAQPEYRGSVMELFMEKNDGTGAKGVLYSFLPHLLAVIFLMVLVTRFLHWSLRFLKQPLIVCQMLAGILLFSFIPKSSNGGIIFLLQPANRRVDHVVGSVGIVFSMFMAAVKVDPATIIQFEKKKSMIIGFGSLLVPFVVGVIICSFRYKDLGLLDPDQQKLVACSFLVLCFTVPIGVYEILAELDLLNSELGRLALSCSMNQGVLGLACIFTYTVIKETQRNNNILYGFLSLIIYLPLGVLVVFVIRPYALWIVRTTPPNARVRDVHIFVIILGVFIMAFLSDICGFFSYTDGPIFVGLAIPDGPPLGTAMIERVELVVSEVLVPIVFMHQGVYVDWAMMKQNRTITHWLGFMVLVLFISKIVANVVLSLYCKMTLKEGLILGFIMNFKGFPDILIFICFINQQLMDRTTFSILILTNMLKTSICALMVSTYYKPLGVRNKIAVQTVEQAQSVRELSIMTCFFDDKPVEALLEFIESVSYMETDNSLCIYSLHLVELHGSLASNLFYHRHDDGCIFTLHMDHVHNHFITFEQTRGRSGVSVSPVTSVAPPNTMHQDICSIILEKNISFVIIPYPKKNSMAELEATTSIQSLLPLVLEKAQCSVGIMVYHGTTMIMGNSSWMCDVCVLFWGGPDDREAIAIASRMTCHPCVNLTVIRFLTTTEQTGNPDDIYQNVSDAQMISKLQVAAEGNNRVNIRDVSVKDANQVISAIRDIYNDRYDLLIVGRKQNCLSMFGDGLTRWTESPELGVIGDMIASDIPYLADLLIVQQQII